MSILEQYPVELWKPCLEIVLTECDGDLRLAARAAQLPEVEFERLCRSLGLTRGVFEVET